jgi:hypothetical protein
MVGWPTGRLFGFQLFGVCVFAVWLFYLLFGCSCGWLAGWLVGWLAGWLVG